MHIPWRGEGAWIASDVSQMIPQCGFESAPLDLGTYALVKAVRDELDVGVSDVTFAVHDLKWVSTAQPVFLQQ